MHVSTTGARVIWDREWRGASAPTAANIVGLDERPDADVVVIQRPGRKHWAQLIPHLQAAGVRVCVDVDDDFEHIDPRNVAFGNYAPGLNEHHNHAWIRRAAELADLTTVSTEPLAAAYAGTGRVVVLPNLVPESYLSVVPASGDALAGAVGRLRAAGVRVDWNAEPPDDDALLVTWTGSVETHPGDLEVTGGGIFRAMAPTGARFHVIGTGKGVPERLGIESVTATGWLPLDRYPQEYARADVAIVPLAPTRFNNGKSALKAAESAALGVPVVMSPTPDNLRLHALGVGLIASHPGKWQRQVSRLLRDEQLRADVAGKGRAVMAGQTYERRCGMWHDAWTSTVGREVAA